MPSGSDIVIFVFGVVFLLSPLILFLYLLYFSCTRKSVGADLSQYFLNKRELDGVDKSLSTERSEDLLEMRKESLEAAKKSTQQFIAELGKKVGLSLDSGKAETKYDLYGDIVSRFSIAFGRGPLWRNNSVYLWIRYRQSGGDVYRIWATECGYHDYEESELSEFFEDVRSALHYRKLHSNNEAVVRVS